MKAAILENYSKKGGDLVICEVPVPEMGRGDVLVNVRTAGVNPLDNMIIRGEVKLITPYKMPLVMGNEFVGMVEKMGADVTGFSVGDRVYGRMPLNRIGAFAEQVAVEASAIAKVPDYLSDEEAAAVPLTALTAMQALELLQAKAGDRLFISGGTGSFGAMAIPIAKSKGLHVITNGNAAGRERVTALGADRFIDYKTEDYAQTLKDVDCVIDTLGDRELPKEFGILKQGGQLVSLRGLPNGEFARRVGMPFIKRLLFKMAGMKYDRMAAKKEQHYHFIFVHEDGRGLQQVSDLFAEKHITASVDTIFALDEVNQALKKVAAGGSNGKTVLKINNNPV
ncbi:MAG: NADP-dependent oxidoreductase [Bacteroidales bacterium]|nr:NADP-dependent oxidoreductase [Bacteroidales bacterium]